MIVNEKFHYAVNKQYKEFRESGLLWFTNTILHAFGWALHLTFDKDGHILNMYPQRRGFRGFTEDINDEGYKKVTKYMADNASDLLKEIQINEDK